MKNHSKRRKHCTLDVVRRSQIFLPRRRSLPGDAGRPKFNQLEMHHYLYLRTQFGENRCTQYRGNRPTNTTSTTHPQTGPITIHCEQCNYTFQCWYCRSCKERLLTYRTASRCYSQAFCQQFSNNPWPPYNSYIYLLK